MKRTLKYWPWAWLWWLAMVAAAVPVVPPPKAGVPPALAYRIKVAAQRRATTPRQTPGKNQPMRKVVAAAKPLVVVAPPPVPLGHAQWNPVAGAGGYRLNWGLASDTNCHWSADAGAATNVTVRLAGGFPYLFTVQSYNAKTTVSGTNRPVVVKTYSSPSLPVPFTPVLPPNAPQLVVAAGQWHVMAKATNVASLYWTSDFKTWTVLGAVTNGPTEFYGLLKKQEYFKIAP